MEQQMMGQSQQTALEPGQQAGQTGQQPRMMEPPEVITDKDLNYLTDAMSWTLLAMKKCAHFAQECEDQQVRQAIDQAGRMHQRHYNMLLQHCKHQNNQVMANVPQPSQMQ